VGGFMVRKTKVGWEILNQIYSISRLIYAKFTNIVAILVCVLVVIFLNSQTDFAEASRNVLFEVNARIVGLLNAPWEMTNKAKDYVDEKLYQKEIRILEERNRALEETIMQITVENQENKRLKALLNFAVPESYKSLSTRLIKSSLDMPSQGFLIPVGKNNDINLSSYIVDGIGLVGKVVAVASDNAKVRLITSINSKTPVVFSDSREKAILVGSSASGNRLHISYCTNIDNLRDGDVAITSGDGSIYPYGILVGTIVKHEDKPYVQTMFSVNNLEFVKVYSENVLN
jgi:rod shape-determining protein MreC